MKHTSRMKRYGVRIGRLVQLYIRPEATGKKSYREPVLHARKWFRTAALADAAIMEWEAV